MKVNFEKKKYIFTKFCGSNFALCRRFMDQKIENIICRSKLAIENIGQIRRALWFSLFVALFVLSLCPFDISVGVGAFVIGLGQISSFLSQNILNPKRNDTE